MAGRFHCQMPSHSSQAAPSSRISTLESTDRFTDEYSFYGWMNPSKCCRTVLCVKMLTWSPQWPVVVGLFLVPAPERWAGSLPGAAGRAALPGRGHHAQPQTPQVPGLQGEQEGAHHVRLAHTSNLINTTLCWIKTNQTSLYYPLMGNWPWKHAVHKYIQYIHINITPNKSMFLFICFYLRLFIKCKRQKLLL